MNNQEEDVRPLLHQLIRKFGLLNKTCCTACETGGVEISLVQSHILYEIDRQHEPSMLQIAETLGIDITTFSRQIQTLSRKKLLRKSPSSSDRRVALLALTEQGEALVQSIDRQVQAYLQRIFNGMKPEEQTGVIRSLQILLKAMEQSGV
ncbi:MarR family winged helix-turn-helix transcriptional regulator [Paenibacillus koleovorans]|uniref:MarR family winged helix-turn-helix transcriptional regulator n=1 Tax=Paenibacillus koleovorans TaxID=121608 RepID=UPI000FDC3415|nr:MarR family transcriptional regulator [Paenibacillus koleovorans]